MSSAQELKAEDVVDVLMSKVKNIFIAGSGGARL